MLTVLQAIVKGAQGIVEKVGSDLGSSPLAHLTAAVSVTFERYTAM